MFEHSGAVGFVMDVQNNARGRPAEKLCQDNLAPLDRQLAHVVAVELEQIERANAATWLLTFDLYLRLSSASV